MFNSNLVVTRYKAPDRHTERRRKAVAKKGKKGKKKR